MNSEPSQIEVGELPFFFPERKTPVLLEPIFLPLLLILLAVLIGFCLILPGIRGRQRIFAAIRVTLLGSAGLWLFFRYVAATFYHKSQLNFRRGKSKFRS